MTAAHPSQPSYVPARIIAAASAHRGRHKAGTWSPFEERHVAMLQSEAGVLGAVHRGELTDSDLVLLEDLDFEVPCERTVKGVQICPEAATWAVTYRHHCIPDATRTQMLCDEDCQRWLSSGTGFCGACKTTGFPIAEHIIRTERIKP